MQRRMLSLALLLGLATSEAFAHGGSAHLKGTIAAISADRVTVKAADGDEASATITKQTLFVRGHAPGKQEDLKQGDRVVVHTRKNDGALEAVEIHSGGHAKVGGGRREVDR